MRAWLEYGSISDKIRTQKRIVMDTELAPTEAEQQAKRERVALIALPIILLIAIGLAWAGSYQGARVISIPIFALCVIIAFLTQWVFAIPSFISQTEKYFDLVGSLTNTLTTLLALILIDVRDTRTLLLASVVVIWAVRLGIFLFRRIQQSGSDSRWDDLKKSFIRFFLAWTLQGLWVSFTLATAWGAMTSSEHVPFGIVGAIGLLIWAIGFAIEVLAYWQKSQFRAKPENAEKFITSGLWSVSRHPNYFGEITLWVGIALLALPALQGWQWVTLISPVFVALLITRISGVPMLEEKADERWGGQEDYEAYKARTPVLIPNPLQKP